MTYEKWKQNWRIGSSNQRMGQAFCNEFLGTTVASQIYYAESYWDADTHITQWLIDNCHYPNVPESIV